MLMAGLDGVKNKIEPLAPVDKDLYELAPDEHAAVPQVPATLPAVLEALEADHEYLTGRRRLHPGPDRDLDRVQAHPGGRSRSRLRPHPHEFELYFDI